MKVMYVTNSTPHYYNHVLNKINSLEGVELVVMAPGNKSEYMGHGIYQTRDGVEFRVIESSEKKHWLSYYHLSGLFRAVFRERPNVIIIIEEYIPNLLLRPHLMFLVKILGIKVIMKSIPFRVKCRNDAYREANTNDYFASKPKFLNLIGNALNLNRVYRLINFYLKEIRIKYPDAHINYVDALEYWSSYGVAPTKIFVSKNSPDTDMMRGVLKNIKEMPLLLSRNEFRLIHIGRLVEWKRVDLLIRAVAELKESYKNVELLVIGAGPDENNLKLLANQLDLDKSVIFRGGIYVPEDIGRYLRESSIYVLAGMGGLSINEAMFYGKPIICSECDGTEKFLVRDGFNGKYFEAGNQTDLVQKIAFLFDRKEDVERMGKNSQRIIDEEVNICTVIDGYVRALNFVTGDRYSIQN